MKKIISVDLQVLQDLNAPHRLNIDRLAELKTYIEDPNYQVFIYITKPLKNRAAYCRQLKNNEIIDNTLGGQAKIIDFYNKKRLTAQRHVQSLEKKTDQISEFIAIGLPQDERFTWLQAMDASIVEWNNRSELNLEKLLPEDEASFSYEKQFRDSLPELADELLARDKRALTVTTIPPSPADFYQMMIEQHVQIKDKIDFLQKTIEAENILPQIFSLENFHIVHATFNGLHFTVEIASIILLCIHLFCDSATSSKWRWLLFCCKKKSTPASEHTKPMQAESPVAKFSVKESEKIAFSDSSTQTRPAEVQSTQASSVPLSRPNSGEQIDSVVVQIDSPKTPVESTSSTSQPEPVKSIAEGQKLPPTQVQKSLNKAKKKSSTFPKRSSQRSDAQEMKETTPLKSRSCSSLPKINYRATEARSYFNLNQKAENQQTVATEEGAEVALMKSSAC